MSDLKVCAVVVTYNRKHQLIDCLHSLLAQSRALDGILILDNFSNDGTAEMLFEQEFIKQMPPKTQEQEFLDKNSFGLKHTKPIEEDSLTQDSVDITYVRLESNKGGAGGFHRGIELGYQLGFDWLWLMDDDGLTDPKALENLLQYNKGIGFLNSLVLDIDKKDFLSFGLKNQSGEVIKTKKKAIQLAEEGRVLGQANPFNGTLISKELVTEIGFPKKEMFIWGDEVDYQMRAKKSGLGIATVVSAFHYHPKARTARSKVPFFSFEITWSGIPFKDYCNIRNTAYIHKQHFPKSVLTSIVKYLIYFCFKPNLASFKLWLNATFDGLFNRWGREKRYF